MLYRNLWYQLRLTTLKRDLNGSLQIGIMGQAQLVYRRVVEGRGRIVTRGMKKGKTNQGLRTHFTFHEFLVEFLQLVLMMNITFVISKFHPFFMAIQ